jgi:hypothetical protein
VPGDVPGEEGSVVDRTKNSFAEALGQAHVALLADLRELEQATRPFSGEGLEELRTRLGAAQAHISEHFRFEEQNGYMDAVRKREPRLERAIQQLAEEHEQLSVVSHNVWQNLSPNVW